MRVSPDMLRKMNRALDISGNIFTLKDIEDHLNNGKMQGHVEGDTWALTQVHDWPQRRAVNIMYLVGFMKDAIKMEPKIEAWAKEQKADMLTAVGREGWMDFKTLGWKKVGNLYSKDI